MDKLGEKDTEVIKEKTKKEGSFSKLKKRINAIKTGEIRTDRSAIAYDLLLFALGFVLSRCHLFFGARPVGIAFVAMLPSGVWQSLIGAALGGITMGLDGLIFAASATVTALIRAAISSGDKDAEGKRLLFGESLLTRMAVSVLAGFAVALYEVLDSGLNEASLLFGLTMIISTPLITFGLSGLVSTGITLKEIISGGEDILSLSEVERGEKYNRVFFQFSALLIIFFVSLAFRGVNIMGISVSYIFSALITLLTAKRFGSIRAAAVGFFSSFIISAELSVSFALMGLCSGVMFGFGAIYAVIVGGVALCAWSGYTAGLTGLLSTLPEYLIAATIGAPMFKRLSEAKATEPPRESIKEDTEDMVGTMALAYQNRFEGGLGELSGTLSKLGELISSHNRTPTRLSREEYRRVVISVAERNCIGCPGASLCAREDIRPCIKNADLIATLLSEGKKITPDDVNTDREFCQRAEVIADIINQSAQVEESNQIILSERDEKGEEYRLIASLLDGIRADDEGERKVNNALTAPLTAALESSGLVGGTIRVFGERQKHFILAGEDESGAKISSFELRKAIEEAAEVRLDTPEYFRRGKMALMECGIRPKLKASWATVGRDGKENEVSGDTAVCFESESGLFYSLISDGMGSGELALKTSRFVSEFLRDSVNIGAAKEPLIHMLNHALRERRDECSATVDLFELDLLSGKGLFLKSGAAPSYVKRESSLFRIRSQTAPIGLLRSIDTEKIRLEVKAGDYIIMLSDGIADQTEDAPWLLLLLGDQPKNDLKEYATLILNEAVKNTDTHDDMTVTVIRIDEV